MTIINTSVIIAHESLCIKRLYTHTLDHPRYFLLWKTFIYSHLCFPHLPSFSSVSKSCPTLCNPMDCNTPGFPVLHHLPEFAQTHVHWVRDAIQLSSLYLFMSYHIFIKITSVRNLEYSSLRLSLCVCAGEGWGLTVYLYFWKFLQLNW